MKSNLRNYYGILFYLVYRNQKFYRNSHYSKNNLMFGTHQELQVIYQVQVRNLLKQNSEKF